VEVTFISMPYYSISGFAVDSDVELPCDVRFTDSETFRSLRIQWQAEPFDLKQVTWIAHRSWGRAYDVGDGVLVSVEDHLQNYIKATGDAMTLRFNRQDPLCVGIAGANTINMGIAACALLQGGWLPLHTASVEIEGRVAAIMAPSGTGKSTLARVLLDDGARFFCDDLTLVEVSLSGVLAIPSLSIHSRLKSDVMQRRGLHLADYQEVYPSNDYYWFPIDVSRRGNTPLNLSSIFILQPTDKVASTGQILYKRVVGGQALTLLMNNLLGMWVTLPYINAKEIADACIKLASTTPIYILEYHKCVEVLPRLADLIRDLSSRAK